MNKNGGNQNSHYSVSRPFSSSRRLRFGPPNFQRMTIFSLPTEIILHILQHLTIKDILNLCWTHPIFKELIDCYPSIWKSISFRDIWPSCTNKRYFEKAAELGNVESLIKLGVAYLYNEGFAAHCLVDGQKIISNGKVAAQMFCQVESQLPDQAPFTWMFIRPPWVAGGACCKECVFRNMKTFAKQNKAPKVNICIAKTYELLDPESCLNEMLKQLQTAAGHGSTLAQYMLWELKYQSTSLVGDKSLALQSIRELREISSVGDLSAQLSLCHRYVLGFYGGYSKDQAAAYVRNFVQSSVSVDVQNIYEGSELTPSMRHILVDWLVEVAYLRRYESLVLHLAVNVVDRFLRAHSITRAKLQLLGIAAVILCSRYLGQDIMTIREGAYLTDHTYSYEEVVRMMGEIAACLKGRIRKLTCLDYIMMIGLAASNDRKTQLLAEYFCEMALQYSDLSVHPQGRLAASCVLLARLTLGIDELWNSNLKAITGFSIKSITHCTLQIHKRCFLDVPITDRRDAPLQAIKLRYSDESFLKVALIPMLSTYKLNSLLGVVVRLRTSVKRDDAFEDDRDLIASPSRKSKKMTVLDRLFCELDSNREKAATPTLEMTNNPAHGLNESGYDGDEEDGNISLLESSLERSFEVASEPAVTEVNSTIHSDVELLLLLMNSQTHSAKNVSSQLVEAKVVVRSPSSTERSGGTSGGFLPLLHSFSLNAETPSDPVVVGQSKSKARLEVSDSHLSPQIIAPQLSRLPQSKRTGTLLPGNETKKSMLERRPRS